MGGWIMVDQMFDAWGKLVLRLTVGILMLFHGVAKLMHPGTLEFISSKLTALGLPDALAYGVYLGEVVAPIMIILGIFARYGGLLVVINMVFAIALAHGGDLFTLTEHGGWRSELQGFYLFGGLAIVLLGSGKFAIKPD
jgi:putative oxidoreductase